MQLVHLFNFLHTFKAFLSLFNVAFRSVSARPIPLLAPIFNSLLIQSSFTDVFALSNRAIIALRQSVFFQQKQFILSHSKVAQRLVDIPPRRRFTIIPRLLASVTIGDALATPPKVASPFQLTGSRVAYFLIYLTDTTLGKEVCNHSSHSNLSEILFTLAEPTRNRKLNQFI